MTKNLSIKPNKVLGGTRETIRKLWSILAAMIWLRLERLTDFRMM